MLNRDQVIWDNRLKANDTVYSDRLLQWDWDKHNDLCQKHFGDTSQMWTGRNPKKIEAFLRDYTGNPELKLCKIWYGVNRSDGYPYWRFDFLTNSK